MLPHISVLTRTLPYHQCPIRLESQSVGRLLATAVRRSFISRGDTELLGVSLATLRRLPVAWTQAQLCPLVIGDKGLGDEISRTCEMNRLAFATGATSHGSFAHYGAKSRRKIKLAASCGVAAQLARRKDAMTRRSGDTAWGLREWALRRSSRSAVANASGEENPSRLGRSIRKNNRPAPGFLE
jgi:hypothetical protein